MVLVISVVFHCVVHEFLIFLVSCSHCVGQEPSSMSVQSKYVVLCSLFLPLPLRVVRHGVLSWPSWPKLPYEALTDLTIKSSLAFTCTL